MYIESQCVSCVKVKCYSLNGIKSLKARPSPMPQDAILVSRLCHCGTLMTEGCVDQLESPDPQRQLEWGHKALEQEGGAS
jgi:hypothetical protein